MTEAETAKKDDATDASSVFPFDFTKLLGPYSLAGVDYSKLLERERKNIAALVEANKIVFDGWQALLRKQAEIFQETMAQAVASARQQDTTKTRAEVARHGFETALANMREMALLASNIQHEVIAVVQKRIGEHMDEFRDSAKSK